MNTTRDWERTMTERASRGRPVVKAAPNGLQAMLQIESVGESEPFRIVPISQCQGTVMSVDDAMAGKVKWATKAGYRVLTRNVPASFAPYNAIIRISRLGTEDNNRDYLAVIVD